MKYHPKRFRYYVNLFLILDDNALEKHFIVSFKKHLQYAAK